MFFLCKLNKLAIYFWFWSPLVSGGYPWQRLEFYRKSFHLCKCLRAATSHWQPSLYWTSHWNSNNICAFIAEPKLLLISSISLNLLALSLSNFRSILSISFDESSTNEANSLFEQNQLLEARRELCQVVSVEPFEFEDPFAFDKAFFTILR